ncbi:MAG: DUF2849 domain-containing protein [Myxococcales bacterium]|nr:DUF2849 domain-containing protein [Myxococcales bacterium]
MKKPNVITGQRLNDGIVVFWTGDSWVERIDRAQVREGDESLASTVESLKLEHRNSIVDIYAIDVEIGGEAPRPVRFRERLRSVGPTVRPDLNRGETAKP